MRALTAACMAALVLSASGCYEIHYLTHQQPQYAPTYQAWHHDFIFGLIEASPPVNVSAVCPAGFARVDNEETFLNGLVAALIQGTVAAVLASVAHLRLVADLYTPTTVTVTCSAGAAAPAASPYGAPGAPPPPPPGSVPPPPPAQ